VTRDPGNVGHASKFIVGVDIEHILDSQGGTEEVASSGVHDSLGLSGGARGLRDRVNILRWVLKLVDSHRE